MQEQVEFIDDSEKVSRQLDRPHKYDPLRGVLWENAFMFSNGAESLVWRNHKPSIEEVHELGCMRQASKRSTKPEWSYVGSITTTAGQIRAIETARGHRLGVEHHPEDGQGAHHAEVKLRPMDGVSIKRNDRSELRLMLERAFGPIERHTCP